MKKIPASAEDAAKLTDDEIAELREYLQNHHNSVKFARKLLALEAERRTTNPKKDD